MKKTVRMLALMALGLALFSTVGCNKLKARDQLNKGVQSYKNARYEEAIEHFKNAVQLDPSLTNARLYRATAFAEQAIDEFKKVLDTNPPKEQQIHSLKGIASLYFNMKKMDLSKQYYQKV